jgi:hypothetical protein
LFVPTQTVATRVAAPVRYFAVGDAIPVNFRKVIVNVLLLALDIRYVF